MTRGTTFKLVPPFEDLEAEFHKKKDKNEGKSSSSFKSDEVATFEKIPDKKDIGYEPETKNDSEEEFKSKRDNMMEDIMRMTT